MSSTRRPPHTDDPSIIESVPDTPDWSEVEGKLMDGRQRCWDTSRAERDRVQPVRPFTRGRRR